MAPKFRCPICEHEFQKDETDRHHLIPKSRGGRGTTTVRLCRVCHEKIHKDFSETELAHSYNTVRSLVESDRMEPYVNWVRLQKIPPRIIRQRKKKRR